MSHPTITELQDGTFDAFVKDHPNLIIDFWAPWCGPCKAFAPVFEAASASGQFPGIAFVKVNVDEAQGLAIKFGIRSIPTLVGVQNGKPTLSQVGSLRAPQFDAVLRKFAGAPAASLSFDD